MKTSALFLFLLLSSPCFSQPVRTILDKNTNNPVPYATVKVLHSLKGEMATEIGEFRMNIEPRDSVFISSAGYRQRFFTASEIGDTIWLDPLPVELQPVVVRETIVVRTVIAGNGRDFLQTALPCRYGPKGPEDACWPWGPSGLKEEFAERIELPDPGKIYRLGKLYVPTRKSRPYGPLLLRVYLEDSITGLPGEEIFIKRVEVTPRNIYKNKVVIDLGPENLFIVESKAFFISLGWPPGAWSNNGVTSLAMYESGKYNSFTRHLKSNEYRWAPFGLLGSINSQRKIGTLYAIELEERTYR